MCFGSPLRAHGPGSLFKRHSKCFALPAACDERETGNTLARLARFVKDWRRLAVDEIVDAGALKRNALPQSAIDSRHLFETEGTENARFRQRAGIRLGHMCAPPWRVFRFNNLEKATCLTLWNFEEYTSTISTTIRPRRILGSPQVLGKQATFDSAARRAHLSLRQARLSCEAGHYPNDALADRSLE
jgi:hypothetical protein